MPLICGTPAMIDRMFGTLTSTTVPVWSALGRVSSEKSPVSSKAPSAAAIFDGWSCVMALACASPV